MGLLTTTVPKQKQASQNAPIYFENITLPNIVPIDEGSYYIFIPLSVLLAIIILSLLVYIMAKNRGRLIHMYCKKRHEIRFLCEDHEYDSPLEQDPDGVKDGVDEMDNDDNSAKSLLRGKLQINYRYENYLSTSQLNRSSELFT